MERERSEGLSTCLEIGKMVQISKIIVKPISNGGKEDWTPDTIFHLPFHDTDYVLKTTEKGGEYVLETPFEFDTDRIDQLDGRLWSYDRSFKGEDSHSYKVYYGAAQANEGHTLYVTIQANGPSLCFACKVKIGE